MQSVCVTVGTLTNWSISALTPPIIELLFKQRIQKKKLFERIPSTKRKVGIPTKKNFALSPEMTLTWYPNLPHLYNQLQIKIVPYQSL